MMVDIYKQENIDPDVGITASSVKSSLSPAVGIPESIAAGGLQGILNMLGGAQNIYRRLPPTIQRGIVGAAMPFAPELPQPVQALMQKPVQPYTFAQRMPYPTLAEISGIAAPALTPLPEVRGLAGIAKLTEQGIPRLAAKATESGLTGAGYGALFGAENPQEKLAAPSVLGMAGGIGMMPFSSIVRAAAQRLIPLGKEIRPYIANSITDIMNKLRSGESDETINRTVFDRASRYYDELMGHDVDLKNNPIGADNYVYVHPGNSIGADYNQLDTIWNRLGLKRFNRKPYDNAIDSEIEKAENALDQYRGTQALKKDKEALIDKLDDYKNVRLSNFNDADTLKRDLNLAINSTPTINATPLDKALRESLHNIKDGVRTSIEQTSKRTPPLMAAWQNADQRFKNQIVPFRSIGKQTSPFYKNYTSGGANVDKFIESYIKPGQSDLLANFVKILPDNETRQLAAAQYFSKTDENPEAFIKKYNALNEQQKGMLLPEHKQELDQLAQLYSKNKALFKKPEVSLYQKPLGLLSLGGTALGATALGHPGLGVAAAIEPFAAQQLAKIFAVSPRIRQLYISGLLQPREPALGALGRGALRGGLSAYLTPSIYQQPGQFIGQ